MATAPVRGRRVLGLVAGDQRRGLAPRQPGRRLRKAQQQQRRARRQDDIGDESRQLAVALTLVHPGLHEAQHARHGDVLGLVPAAKAGARHLFETGGKPAPRGLRQVGEIGPVIPRALEQQEGIGHAHRDRREAEAAPQPARQCHQQRIDTQMRAHPHPVRDAKDDEPGKQEPGQLHPPEDAGVEDVAQHDIDEGDQRHEPQQEGDGRLLEPVDGTRERAALRARLGHGASPVPAGVRAPRFSLPARPGTAPGRARRGLRSPR